MPLAKDERTVLGHNWGTSRLTQQGYVNQNLFAFHMMPPNVQQEIANALASGNPELTNAATQRFMHYAQVRS